MTHIYAFGSVCRGEVTPESDVDLLALTAGADSRFNPDIYSVYSYGRMAEIWRMGTPFAWHLFLEARLLHSLDSSDYLRGLGSPAAYLAATEDCQRFLELFQKSAKSIRAGSNSVVFELSNIFLAIRNVATCYSLGVGAPDFSRHAARRLGTEGLDISEETFLTLERARLLCTRGLGESISPDLARSAFTQLELVEDWMQTLLTSVRKR
ncbi:nucleotidyltransferase domain-containing protein [Stenotrophomonas sp. GZD-301]|uniref:nucleotidyltransferase domain-containing protein n=1 Tax=Stenotrophomonas sp. GZD-301 TaxID=3404814 RepID=UPI003BB4CBB6